MMVMSDKISCIFIVFFNNKFPEKLIKKFMIKKTMKMQLILSLMTII